MNITAIMGIPLTLCWLVAMVVFAALEGVTIALTSIWFAAGALAALLVSLFIPSFLVQLWVFAIVSLLTLFLVRPLASRYFRPKDHAATNVVDAIIGKEAVVTEDIDNLQAKGQAKVCGQIWTARSEQDTVIPAGTVVTVLRIEGVKIYVQPKQS